MAMKISIRKAINRAKHRSSIYTIIINDVGEITTITRASSNFASLRTVIPMSVVHQWKPKKGDKLEWEWQVLKGEMVLIVKKARSKED